MRSKASLSMATKSTEEESGGEGARQVELVSMDEEDTPLLRRQPPQEVG